MMGELAFEKNKFEQEELYGRINGLNSLVEHLVMGKLAESEESIWTQFKVVV